MHIAHQATIWTVICFVLVNLISTSLSLQVAWLDPKTAHTILASNSPASIHQKATTSSQLRLKKIEKNIKKSKLLWFPGSESIGRSKYLNIRNKEKHPLLTYIGHKINDKKNDKQKHPKRKLEDSQFSEQDVKLRKMIEKKYNIGIEEPYPSKVSGVVQTTSNMLGQNQLIIGTFQDMLEFDQLLYNSVKQTQNVHEIRPKHHHMHIGHNDNIHPINKGSKMHGERFIPDFRLKKRQNQSDIAIASEMRNNASGNATSDKDEHKHDPNILKTPFATDDRNDIMQFQGKNLICSTLHFHAKACDFNFNGYSELQPFGMLYEKWDNNDVISSKYVETSDTDLADTFEPQSKEETLTKIYSHIVSLKERQDITAQMSQHILKHKFADVFKDYFLESPSKSPAPEYRSNVHKHKSKSEEKYNMHQPTQEQVLQQLAGLVQQHFKQGVILDPYQAQQN